MKLTTKLLSFLHRVFDKDPEQFLALRLRYAGAGMTWRVADARLVTVPVGGPGVALSIDLTQYRIGELVNYLAAQLGYTVEYADQTELSLLGAAALLDGAGDQNKSNGDHLYAYTSVLWSYLEANAVELGAAQRQIDQMLLQMSTRTAADIWLDELGGYYAVPRMQGEADTSYGLRIIAEVLRPRGNNVAIEAAISAYTGQSSKVTDVTIYSALRPVYDGADSHNGADQYNSTSSPLYGLFDVEYGYDIINGGDISAFAQIVRGLIERLRDAGTHLRSLRLTGSVLEDQLSAPADISTDLPLLVGPNLADVFSSPSDVLAAASMLTSFQDTPAAGLDALGLSLQPNYAYAAIRFHDGVITYSSGTPTSETV